MKPVFNPAYRSLYRKIILKGRHQRVELPLKMPDYHEEVSKSL